MGVVFLEFSDDNYVCITVDSSVATGVRAVYDDLGNINAAVPPHGLNLFGNFFWGREGCPRLWP
jgi:hypothetical protein